MRNFYTSKISFEKLILNFVLTKQKVFCKILKFLYYIYRTPVFPPRCIFYPMRHSIFGFQIESC